METGVTSKSPQPRQRRVLRRVGSALVWAVVVLLGAFGVVFSFANYPWFGASVVALFLLLVGYSEQTRRRAQRAREAERRRNRPRP
jgi:membrane-bound ClpP family serine protease